MTNSTPAVQLLMHSISKQATTATGETVTTYDAEQIRYQLYNIDSDNFAASLRSYKDALLTASIIKDNVLPGVGTVVAEQIAKIAENAVISISGKSSEKGKLLHALLKDAHEERIVYAGLPGNPPVGQQAPAGGQQRQSGF